MKLQKRENTGKDSQVTCLSQTETENVRKYDKFAFEFRYFLTIIFIKVENEENINLSTFTRNPGY